MTKLDQPITRQPATHHAQAPARAARPLPPIDGRLGWPIPEWRMLTGASPATTSRQIRRGDLKVVRIGPTKIIPRSEAVRLGFIQS
jgi:hypothetical protein